MNYIKIDPFDDKNGVGARITLFVAGCPHKCVGCFNKESWSYLAGKSFSEDTKKSLLNLFSKDEKFLTGLSVLGGEPLAPRNVQEVITLCRDFKDRFPNKDIWVWSGYTLEEIQSSDAAQVLTLIDTLVDGKFVKELADTELEYRGSSNQRILKKGIHF